MRTITNKGGNTDLRAMLLAAGVGEYNAVLGIQYMNMLPTTTDPYAQGVQLIVKGLQRLLVQRGARLAVDGGMGTNTVAALIPYAGPNWYTKSWAQIYGDVTDGRLWSSSDRNGRGGLGEWREELGHTAYSHIGTAEDLGADLVGGSFYCSVANPQGGCTPLAGVAKPLNQVTLEMFQRLQRVINANLHAAGKSLIDVDGRIGPATVAAFKWMIYRAGFENVRLAYQGIVDVDGIAQSATSLLVKLEPKLVADHISLVADPKPSSPPSLPGPNGTVINPSNLSIGSSMGFQQALPFAAAGIGVLLLLQLAGIGITGTKKKRSKR